MSISADDVSKALGILVIAIWVLALLPQVFINWRRRSASGLAPTLVVLWLLGDTCGLIGAFLTHQLAFQKANCIWHFLIDAVLFTQWLAFHRSDSERIAIENKREEEIWHQQQVQHRTRRLSLEQALALNDEQTPMFVTRERPELLAPRVPLLPPLLARKKDERSRRARKARRTKALVGSLSVVLLFLLLLIILRWKTHLLDSVHVPSGPLSHRATRGIGRALAWTCAFLYLGSRLPQLYHNWARQSCQGLSIALFLLASVANVSYCTSIFLNSRARKADGSWNAKYFLEAAPFLVTASGAFIFDQLITAQWVYYRGWDQPNPRHRLEPALERRQALVADGLIPSTAGTPARVSSYGGPVDAFHPPNQSTDEHAPLLAH